MTDRDTPIRLADIIPLAFPHGGMTVSGCGAGRMMDVDEIRIEAERQIAAALDEVRATFGADTIPDFAMGMVRETLTVTPINHHQTPPTKDETMEDMSDILVAVIKTAREHETALNEIRAEMGLAALPKSALIRELEDGGVRTIVEDAVLGR